jgi:hypothetical protein
MSLQRWVLLGAAVLNAGCGTSRSTRSSACSSVKSIADEALPVSSSLEKYDPSAVLLLFRASSDKLTIESRCNARLVNKVIAKHKRLDGNLEDIGDDPIDFSKLHVYLESGESNLELQTSAHCFFRIWDSRVDHQTKSNPAIAAEPIRSYLRDMKTRYQLYRSMLTTPQTIVAYLPDRTPVTFKYTLPVTPLYEKFFAAIDKEPSDLLITTVGRELSKTSVIVDELIRNECNVTHTTLNRIDRTIAAENATTKRADVTDAIAMAPFMSSSSVSDEIMDFIRTRVTSSGRRRLCFSQTDMVVTPIILTETTSAVQKTLLAGIETELKNKITDYTSHINGTTTAAEKYIPEITASTTVPPLGADIESCSFSSTHPGIAITDGFAKRMEKSFIQNWNLNQVSQSTFYPAFKAAFPNLKKIDSDLGFVNTLLSQAVWKEGCSVAGLQQASSGMGCKDVRKTNSGRCPLTVAEADSLHEHIKRSLRLSSTGAVHMLKRQRDAGALALTMPFAEMRDYIGYACSTNGTAECVLAGKIKAILDSLAPQFVISTGVENIELTGDKYNLAVTSISDDMQFICRFVPTGYFASQELTGKLFRDFTDDSKAILQEGLTAKVQDFKVIGARFVYFKCITAGTKRLYNNFNTSTGLQHSLKFSEISFVKTNKSDFGGRTELSNAEVQEAGQPVKLPFAAMFIGDAAQNLPSVELAARLIAGPHIEISSCKVGQAVFFCEDLTANLRTNTILETLAGELQLVRAHLNFNTKVPSWLSDKEKAKFGEAAFPEANFSAESARYYLSAGDSGTTTNVFGLWPTSMLSTVDDLPVSGGLAVIPSTGGQKVQSSKGDDCR